MFKNVSKSLKIVASVLIVVGTILAALIVIACGVLAVLNIYELWWLIVLGILGGGMVFISFLIPAYFVYGFAEIIQNTKDKNSNKYYDELPEL